MKNKEYEGLSSREIDEKYRKMGEDIKHSIYISSDVIDNTPTVGAYFNRSI